MRLEKLSTELLRWRQKEDVATRKEESVTEELELPSEERHDLLECLTVLVQNAAMNVQMQTRLSEQARAKKADDTVDQLLQDMDRLSLWSEYEGGFTAEQYEKLGEVHETLTGILSGPRRPTAGGLRDDAIETITRKAAKAWARGDSLTLEEKLQGKTPSEVTIIEDMAAWLLSQRRDGYTKRQVQLIARVQQRYTREALRRRLLQMPLECAVKFEGRTPFERGDPMGTKRRDKHDFSMQEYVFARGEPAYLSHGYVYKETACFVWLVVEGNGKIIQKGKQNVERVGAPLRTVQQRLDDIFAEVDNYME